MTEHKLVVRIPPVGRLYVVGVQLQLATVLVQVEHVRVAIAVSYVRDIIDTTARTISREGTRLYFICDQESPMPRTKYISFLDVKRILYAKP